MLYLVEIKCRSVFPFTLAEIHKVVADCRVVNKGNGGHAQVLILVECYFVYWILHNLSKFSMNKDYFHADFPAYCCTLTRFLFTLLMSVTATVGWKSICLIRSVMASI